MKFTQVTTGFGAVVPFFVVFCLLCAPVATSAPAARGTYLSPGALAVDGARSIAYTALTTAKSIAVTDLKTEKTTRVEIGQNPNNLILSPDGNTLYVSTGDARGAIEVLAAPALKRKTLIPVGHTPDGLALSADGKTLYVANRFTENIAVINLATGKVISTIPALREPRTIVLSPDGKTLAVANFMPHQAATDPNIAATITFIDTARNTIRAQITLGTGAQSLTGMTFSPDGSLLYAVHLLSRFGVPITQLDRGWTNTDALTVINVKEAKIHVTVLLDDPDNGASSPFGICLANDGPEKGKKLYIAIAGTHELMTLDVEKMLARVQGFLDGKEKIPYIVSKGEFAVSLSFTSAFKQRHRLKGRSPRAIAWVPGSARAATDTKPGSEGTLLISSNFSTALDKVVLGVGSNPRPAFSEIVLGTEPAPDAIRRGEANFWDASICYQQWLSCISCHADGRADSINWDQINDGTGNPKNTKSLLFSHFTPPSMITGIRKNAELAVRKGITHNLFTVQPEEFAKDIDEFLRNLRPLESPFLAEYRAKDPKGKGKELFASTGCASCHSGEYLTDMQMHDVGTGIENDKGRKFDTPTLREIWRTPPYLYDGRAITIKDVLTIHNLGDAHGVTQHLSKEEIDLLELYIKTL
ncbi:MAG: beta-propeller fold lactonase family protein [Puniceicoccales bacterium]|jgi:YVTN family beta-propeller protein|nr:beta-propeller fold lactonase family protein [Puniceicoccales bacterium]